MSTRIQNDASESLLKLLFVFLSGPFTFLVLLRKNRKCKNRFLTVRKLGIYKMDKEENRTKQNAL